MNATDARRVLLLRAVETTAAADAAGAGWAVADADGISAEARRRVGDPTAAVQGGTRASLQSDRLTAERFLAQRAGLGLDLLASREPDWPGADAARSLPHGRWLGALLLVAALLAGAAGDSLASGRRINLLAPPLLALLAWNLAVYVALMGWALRGGLRRRGPAPTAGEGVLVAVAVAGAGRRAGHAAPSPQHGPVDGLVRLGQRLGQRLAARAEPRWVTAARARFVADWFGLTAPLQRRRAAAWLHAAAALLALGAVLSMYGRGLVFDYRAGWDSTFLQPGQVRAILAAVLGPAAGVSGLALPDAEAIAGLRWADGGSGEGAARWIHLYALTLGAVVVLPRSLLAAAAALGAHRAARSLALPLDEPYFRRLLRQSPSAAHPVTVLPYSYRLGPAQRAGLAGALGDALGGGAQPQLAPVLPMGAEDALPAGLPEPLADTVVALFALTATPERETHGAFVHALAAALPGRCTLQVVVDESVFRQQLATGEEGAQRLAQRRLAWQRMLGDLKLPAPRFADLSAGQAA